MSHALLEILSSHLGAGRLGASHIEGLARLDRLCPPEARHPAPARLYRSVTISREDNAKLERGEEVNLDPRSHDCWSRSHLAIRPLLRVRAGQYEDLGACIILQRDFGPDDIAVDVELLARHLGMDDGSSSQWFNYVVPEQEVIVRNPGNAVTIRPRDVLHSWRADDLSRLWEPQVGEIFEDRHYVNRTVDEFLGSDGSGSMLVRSGDIHYRMDFQSGYWFCTEETPISSPVEP